MHAHLRLCWLLHSLRATAYSFTAAGACSRSLSLPSVLTLYSFVFTHSTAACALFWSVEFAPCFRSVRCCAYECACFAYRYIYWCSVIHNGKCCRIYTNEQIYVHMNRHTTWHNDTILWLLGYLTPPPFFSRSLLPLLFGHLNEVCVKVF